MSTDSVAEAPVSSESQSVSLANYVIDPFATSLEGLRSDNARWERPHEVELITYVFPRGDVAPRGFSVAVGADPGESVYDQVTPEGYPHFAVVVHPDEIPTIDLKEMFVDFEAKLRGVMNHGFT